MTTGDLNFQRCGSGEPLVLLHGIGSELCVWEPVLERLCTERDVIAARCSPAPSGSTCR